MRVAGGILSFLTRQVVLVIAMSSLLLILWGWGRPLGLPFLFWLPRGSHEATLGGGARFLVGMAVGAFLAASLFVGLLVEGATRNWTPPSFRRHLVAWAAFVFLLLVVVFARGPYRSLPQGEHPTITLREASVALFGEAAGLWLGVALILWISEHSLARQLALALWGGIRAPTTLKDPGLHTTAAVLFATATTGYVVLLVLNRFLSYRPYPAIAMLMLLTGVVALHGFVAYWLPRMQLAIYLLLVVAWAAASAVGQRARVPALESLAEGGSPRLLSDREALEAWRKETGGKRDLIVVAAMGGGIRSALWTTVVLTELEKAFGPGLGGRVRLITGASGGLLGASYWAATLGPGQSGHSDPEALRNAIALGSLDAVTSSLVFRDLWPPPFRIGDDRGRSLEKAWDRHTKEALAKDFLQLEEGERLGWRPSLVLTPMLVEDGRRLVISNLDLEDLLSNDGPLLGESLQKPSYSISGRLLFKCLPAAQAKLPLSTALRLQANFPWVLPSTELAPLGPGEPRLRAVDAGYYDETGVDLATLWISKNRAWLRDNARGVALLQIRDQSSAGRHVLPSQPRTFVERASDGFATPVSALLRARDSTAAFRDDRGVAALADAMNHAGERPFFTTAIFELTRPASLSWSLTEDESQEIRKDTCACSNQRALDGIREWLAAGGNP
jgi:hypothetical protein